MTESRARLKRPSEAPQPAAHPTAKASVTPHPLLSLQRAVGNRATSDLVARRNVTVPGVGGTAQHDPMLAVQREVGAGTQALIEHFTPKATTGATNAPPATNATSPTIDETELQERAKFHAKEVISSVQPIEANITGTLQAIAAANGGRLEGLQHRLKTEASLQRKLADLARTRVKGGESMEDALRAEAANTKDALRYTITVPPEAYVVLADSKLRDALADKGATRIKASNAWADPQGSYKGFNSAYEMASPSGRPVLFEVQIHTPESWEMKSELHQQYEDARKDVRMSKAAKAWLNNYMKSRWSGVKTPKGIEEYDARMNKRNTTQG